MGTQFFIQYSNALEHWGLQEFLNRNAIFFQPQADQETSHQRQRVLRGTSSSRETQRKLGFADEDSMVVVWVTEGSEGWEKREATA